jgi:TatD DNase family protein
LELNIDLAKETGKPLVIHCRDAFEDLYEILNGQYSMLNGIQMHCWTGSWEWAEKFLGLGCYLSFGGILTFKKSDELREVAKLVPENRLLVETDSPYLAPEPVRGGRNTPANVKYVLDCLARARGLNNQSMSKITVENARGLFKLP